MRPPEIEGRRLPTETFDAAVGGHAITISVARDALPQVLPDGTLVFGRVVEVVFVGRGKIGQGVDLLLTDLGIAISRAIQHRDPNTGKALAIAERGWGPEGGSPTAHQAPEGRGGET